MRLMALVEVRPLSRRSLSRNVMEVVTVPVRVVTSPALLGRCLRSVVVTCLV